MGSYPFLGYFFQKKTWLEFELAIKSKYSTLPTIPQGFSLSLSLYIYIYICVCVCVCVLKGIGLQRDFLELIIFLLHVFLAFCCCQRTFNDFGGIVFGLYIGDRFDRVASPFQFCDKFSFLQVLVLSFSFSSFYKSVFYVFVCLCGCTSLPPN